jgi:hypothetical protein
MGNIRGNYVVSWQVTDVARVVEVLVHVLVIAASHIVVCIGVVVVVACVVVVVVGVVVIHPLSLFMLYF